jgi:hypothetical protein
MTFANSGRADGSYAVQVSIKPRSSAVTSRGQRQVDPVPASHPAIVVERITQRGPRQKSSTRADCASYIS